MIHVDPQQRPRPPAMSGPMHGASKAHQPRRGLVRPGRLAALLGLVLALLGLGGCIFLFQGLEYMRDVDPGVSGAARRTVGSVKGTCDLAPSRKDPDAGLVAMVDGFELKNYPVLAVGAFTVADQVATGLESPDLAEIVLASFRADLLQDLTRYSRLFNVVLDAPSPTPPPGGARVLRVEVQATTMTFARDEAIVQLEACFRDGESGEPVLATATRRSHWHQKAGPALRGALHGVLVDLTRFLDRLAKGFATGAPPVRPPA
jgi:hypothetical protein